MLLKKFPDGLQGSRHMRFNGEGREAHLFAGFFIT